MKSLGLCLLFAALATPALAAPPAGYSLVWADEFDEGTLPDTSKWVYDAEANKTGWYNNELQYYAVSRQQNTAVSGGNLTITARKERLGEFADYGGQDYSSGRLITRGTFAFTYGFVEARAKLPCGQGLWPSVWMLGTADKWPKGGEIDIMEHLNAENAVYGTIHTQSTAGTSGDGSSVTVANLCADFHLYQMEWTARDLRIGVDGAGYHTYRNKGPGKDQWPFDAPQYVLLNLAVGGDWPGAPDDGVFPASFIVDYVRVYQKP